MNKKRFILVTLLVGILFCNLYYVSACTNKLYTNNLEYAEGPADNPLMGFVSWGTIKGDFPHSLEYYSVALNEVQTGYDAFDWSVVEKYLDECKSNGNQAVLRFYVDCPGKETGVPKFLIDESLQLYSYELDGENGLCPDYSNKNLQDALVDFIKAFGKKYDGDPRIGFVEAGLLGFWGEWHTHPYKQWYPSSELCSLITKTYDESFSKTYVMLREPTEINANLNVGYHDDMFAIDNNEFLQKIKQFNLVDKWRNTPIGGELAPNIQEKYFTTAIKEAFDWDESVQLIHPSWLLNAEICNYTDSDKEEAILCAKKLGYKFNVQKAEVNTENNIMKVNVYLNNVGTAPFYYDWNIKLRVEDVSNDETYDFDTDWKLTTIKQLNTTYTFSKEISDIDLSKNGEYKIYMKVINPMEGGKNLRFANEEQQSDGWIQLIDFSM
ncbi:MAG: DUF4832 domain-containing protein [Clostridium sp.]|nr:DUF4832 domain-containing protein [Clostridium sp.]